jgi:voltage-gated potassium channel Kch
MVLRTLWRDHRLTALTALALLVVGLGFVGFWTTNEGSPLDAAYDSLSLLALNFEDPRRGRAEELPLTLQIARFGVPLVAAWATVTALMAVFREQSDVLRSQHARGHVVVCGLGGRGLRLAKTFARRGVRVVAIENQRTIGSVHEARAAGVRVVLGDATDADVLRRAGVARARYLVSVCSDDATNAAVVARLERLAASRSSTLEAFAHISRLELADDLTGAALARDTPQLAIEWFNVADRAAKAMLREHADLAAWAGGARPAHVVIAGLDDVGASLLVNASRQWAALAVPEASRLRVTVAAEGGSAWLDALVSRYSALETTLDVSTYDEDVCAPGRISDAHDRLGDADAVFVCGGDDTESIELAFAVDRIVDAGRPIVVRLLVESSGFVELLGGERGEGSVGRISVFGLVERTLAPEMISDSLHESLARMFHAQYVAQVVRGGNATVYERLEPWEDLPESFRDANRAQARHISAKLDAVGCAVRPLADWSASLVQFADHEVELLARMEHERWMAERQGAGWAWGPKRDDDRRLNPYLVDFDRLPPKIQEYDAMFARELPRTLAAAGYEVHRTAAGEAAAPGRAVARSV